MHTTTVTRDTCVFSLRPVELALSWSGEDLIPNLWEACKDNLEHKFMLECPLPAYASPNNGWLQNSAAILYISMASLRSSSIANVSNMITIIHGK